MRAKRQWKGPFEKGRFISPVLDALDRHKYLMTQMYEHSYLLKVKSSNLESESWSRSFRYEFNFSEEFSYENFFVGAFSSNPSFQKKSGSQKQFPNEWRK